MKLKVKYLENYDRKWGDLASKEGDSGYDLRAAITKEEALRPGERKLIPTGLQVELEDKIGYLNEDGDTEEFNNKEMEIQIRPRSGLAVKNGISVVNTPGTVDFSFRGQMQVILINLGNEDFVINPGDRIAQMVVCPVYKPLVVEVEELEESARGDKGFGSSGTN